MDAVQEDALITVLFCNYCGKAVKVYANDRRALRCPYCKGIMQDMNMPGWNELDIVEKENLLLDWKQQARDSKRLDERLFEKRNHSRIIRRRLRKLGIYISSFCISSLFIYFFQYNKIILGGIPTAIIYLIAFFLAKIIADSIA